MRKILIWGYCNLMLLLYPFKKKINILRDEEMVDYIKNNNLSIIRLGDGEFGLLKLKKDIHYQEYNENLFKEMEELYYNYSINSKYLLSIPYFLLNSVIWFKKMPYGFTACFSRYRLFFMKHYNKHLVYGDAFLFRRGNKKVYEKLWDKEEQIILIHNDVKWAKQLEKEYNIKVNFISIPARNSYDVIDEVEKNIKIVNKDKKNKILISAGPMAKVLAYRLSKIGYIVYDTGHCFDDPLSDKE